MNLQKENSHSISSDLMWLFSILPFGCTIQTVPNFEEISCENKKMY